jgi:galactofuranose transport system ATP-binding protein
VAEPPDQPSSPGDPLLQVRALVVDYPGVRALDGVTLDVRSGEVLALMGENGAGKSTLIRVLTGVCRPASGSMTLGSAPFSPRSAREAEDSGVAAVHQELDLIPTMSVEDNICLGRQPVRLGLISPAALRRRARAALQRLKLALDTRRVLGSLPVAVQQMVAIVRALDVRSRVLVLDEPTSSLDADETRRLLAILRGLRQQGLAIVLVTHFLSQAYEIADRIAVLRNARHVGTWAAATLTRAALVEAMTGKTPASARAPLALDTPAPAPPGTVLSFERLGRRGVIEPVSGRLDRGESLGLAGLLGSGRTELARLLFGADRPEGGTVSVESRRLRPGSVPDAIGAGVAFTPEDRKADGLILDLCVRENIILALQARRGPLRPIPRAEQERLCAHYMRALGIRAPGIQTPVRQLSGGNQQKVLLARWLAMRPRILILDEPTRGIDVGARAEIEAIIAGLRSSGVGVLLISSELDELVRLCGRILVLRDRHAAGELHGPHISEDRILQLIAGAEPSSTAEPA